MLQKKKKKKPFRLALYLVETQIEPRRTGGETLTM